VSQNTHTDLLLSAYPYRCTGQYWFFQLLHFLKLQDSSYSFSPDGILKGQRFWGWVVLLSST